jgi:mannose-6-phosphate isomerase-like protein (cupin superfamily)
MSYPEPRYLGEKGQVSAIYHSTGSKPDLTIGSSSVLRYLATGESTHGQFGLYRWDFGPNPSGPRPHFHRTMSESFFILSGEVQLFNGERWINATEGDFLYVPEGGVHAFSSEPGAHASMLILFVPGAPREAYFEALAEIAASGRQLTDEEWIELGRRHDNYFILESI